MHQPIDPPTQPSPPGGRLVVRIVVKDQRPADKRELRRIRLHASLRIPATARAGTASDPAYVYFEHRCLRRGPWLQTSAVGARSGRADARSGRAGARKGTRNAQRPLFFRPASICSEGTSDDEDLAHLGESLQGLARPTGAAA